MSKLRMTRNAPSECGLCRIIFNARPALQARTDHEANKHGIGAAVALVNEELAGEHEAHG